MNADISSILKSGWGLFLGLACVVSVVLDFAVRQHLPLFSNGSFTLGWLFVVGLFIVPAACARQIGIAPMNSFLAVVWCVIAILAWSVIHAISGESGPQHTARPNLALLGGLALCWRLLVTPKMVSIVPESELITPAVPQTTAEGTQQPVVVPATAAPPSLNPTAKDSSLITEQRVETASARAFDGMSPYKKRILVGGILAICVSAAIYSLVEDETPSVAWMFVISAIWASLAYLLPDSFFIRMKALLNWRLWLKLAAVGIGILAVIFTGAVITQIVKRDADTPNPSEKAPKILESDALMIARSIDQAPETDRPWMLDLLNRYQQQQREAGEPDWPSFERAKAEREASLRRIFESPDKIERDPKQMSQNPVMPRLLEADAEFLTLNYDTLLPEEQEKAKEWLQRYKQQQADEGEPLFPSEVKRRNERELSLRRMFESPDKIDYDPGPFSQNPQEAKMIHANMAFLASRCQKEPAEVASRYDFLLSEYAQLHFGATGKVDTATFYSLVQKHYGNHKADASATQGLPIHIGPPSSLPREP